MTKGAYNWAAIYGKFNFSPKELRFIGLKQEYGDGVPGPALGAALCNQWFDGGAISADLTFSAVSDRSACDLVLFFNLTNLSFVCAGLGGESLYNVRSFNIHQPNQWTNYSATGQSGNLVAGKTYHLECRVRGSFVTLLVDEVEVAAAMLPAPLPRSQVGLWCRDYTDIVARNYNVKTEPPRAFVVMQFTSPYNELYEEVVKPICSEFDVQAVRADETYGPGLIMADVIRQIDEANFIIAEITPANPNVYYEVGYAHARGKPTILIADRCIERLPFDVSPIRTLFYENTIDGKRRFEEGLRRHVMAILDPSGGSGPR